MSHSRSMATANGLPSIAAPHPEGGYYREVFRSRRAEMGLEAAEGGGEVHK